MVQKQKSLKKNAVYNMIRNLMNIIFPIISFPYASRILMPEGLGKVNFANSIIEYFILIAGLGIKSYASRECAKVRDDRGKLSKLSKEILMINGISTLVAYILLAISLVFVPKLASYRILLIVCSTKILFSTIGMDWLYTANEEYRYITMRSVFFQILSIIFLFTFIRSKDDYVLYAGMGVFSSVGSNICNLIYARKFISIKTKANVEIKKHLKPIFTFFGTSLATKLHTALDSVMLGFMASDVAVGYYSAANKISLLIRQLIGAITSTLMPRSSYYLESGDKVKYRQMVFKAANVSLFFSIPAATGLYFLCKPIILIFSGENYLPALNIMKIIVPTLIICTFCSFLNDLILVPARKEKILLIAQCAGAALNLILNSLFIPIWGAFGAAFATLIVEIVITSIEFAFAFKLLKSRAIFISFLQPLIASAVMFAVICLLFSRIENPLLQTVLSITTGSAVYAAITLLMKNQTALIIVGTIKKRVPHKKQNIDETKEN